MKYIGIDIGSSYMKAFLLDTDQDTVSAHWTEAMPGKLEEQTEGAFELDAEEIVRRVQKLIKRFVGVCCGELEGVLLSVQMHGFVYAVPGRADRYVSWQDSRCLNQIPDGNKSYLEYLKEWVSEDDMRENGVYIKPSMGLCNLFTMLQQKPLMDRKGTVYTLGSYIIHALTGNNIAHIESLAPLGVMNVRKKCLHISLLKRLGLGEISFPEIADDDFQICGIYKEAGQELKIYPDFGDMQTAVLGSDVRQGEVIINTATASQIARISEEFIPGSYEIRPYFENKYLYTISDMPAGRNLGVLIQFIRETVKEMTGSELTEDEVWEKVHTVDKAKTDGLQVDVNFFKNPHFCIGGSIQNITSTNLHICTIFASAYRNMAETYWKYIQLLAEHPEKIRGIVCAGGVNWKTPELVEQIKNVSQKPCRLSEMKDEAAAGLLRLAHMCAETIG